jgi:hypothetical protein
MKWSVDKCSIVEWSVAGWSGVKVLVTGCLQLCVLFVCKCVLYYCHRVLTHLVSTKCISYHIIYHIIISYHISCLDPDIIRHHRLKNWGIYTSDFKNHCNTMFNLTHGSPLTILHPIFKWDDSGNWKSKHYTALCCEPALVDGMVSHKTDYEMNEFSDLSQRTWCVSIFISNRHDDSGNWKRKHYNARPSHKTHY